MLTAVLVFTPRHIIHRIYNLSYQLTLYGPSLTWTNLLLDHMLANVVSLKPTSNLWYWWTFRENYHCVMRMIFWNVQISSVANIFSHFPKSGEQHKFYNRCKFQQYFPLIFHLSPNFVWYIPERNLDSRCSWLALLSHSKRVLWSNCTGAFLS